MPERDRSRALADYPTDLLNSPPQDLAAAVTFTVAPLLPIRDAAGPSATPPANRERQALESVTLPPPAGACQRSRRVCQPCRRIRGDRAVA